MLNVMKNLIFIHVVWDAGLLKEDDCSNVALIVKVTKRLMRGDGLFVENVLVAD
jgi:hypothetical protein